jgi:glycerol dehydrogenase
MPTPIRTVMSPARYVQGKDAITRLGEFVAPIGKRPLIVSDDIVWGLVEEAVTASFGAAELGVERVGFGRFATPAAIDELVETIQGASADVVVAIGGGSAIDAAKAAGHLAGIRWVSVPTVASTDAPTSALAVVYTDEGEFIEYRFFPRNPDLVLIDTQLVANAPVQFLVAGIGDALATWIEARASAKASATTMAGGLATQAGTALAELSWRIIHENALSALDAVRPRDPQRPDRRSADARPHARPEGQHRVAHAARARGRAPRRDRGLRRVHDSRRAAQHADRDRPQHGRHRGA